MHSKSSHPILIVEDERIVARDLQKMLGEWGYDVLAAVSSGSDALARAAEKSPEIALMDIHIKGAIDGIETGTILYERYGTAIIFLTAFADDATVERAKKSRPYGYLVKPVTSAMLKRTIDLALHRFAVDREVSSREAELSRSNLQMSALVGHLQTAVLVEDELRQVQQTNVTFCSVFCPGESPDDLTGTHAIDLLGRGMSLFAEPEHARARIDELTGAHETVTGELVRFADGRTFERDYVPIVSHGRPAGQVWTYRDVTERVRDREALEQSSVRNRRLAIFDELTGLHNRRGFHLAADHHLKVARRGEQQTVIFFMDIDGLKQINDSYGHVTGDQAIRDMANVLTETFRDTDVVGRLGGDEFVVIASMPPRDVTAARIRLRQHLDEFNALSSRPYQLETSIGAALYIDGDTVDSLLSRADTAMYLEKRAGRPN